MTSSAEDDSSSDEETPKKAGHERTLATDDFLVGLSDDIVRSLTPESNWIIVHTCRVV